jgi:tetratricopeptide (TPR) repeat protein
MHEKDYKSARQWLEQIGSDAPPDVLVPAKVLLAHVLMGEKNFPGAAKEWELLRGAPNTPAGMRLTATYQLGECKLKVGESETAARLFEEAAKNDGPESTAAAIKLAELHLRSIDPARHKTAVDLLANAVRGVREPSGFDTTLVSLNDVQTVFESAVTTLLADGAHEQALKAARSYESVAVPGRDRERRAEVLGAWGGALLKAKSPEAQPIFKAAADEFAALAAFQPKTDGKLEMLRRSASYYRQAGDPAAAAKRLEEAVLLPEIPEPVQPALWLELADALLAANRPDDVYRIFNKVMAEIGPLATATRYRLAHQFTATRHPDLVRLGRALFEQIVKQQNVSTAEHEFHERAFIELANAFIREGNFAGAEARLRTQLNIYPNRPEAAYARLLLGVCLLQRAAAPSAAPADATKMRNEAVSTFKQIVAECDASERRNGKLTEREAWLRLQAALRVLQAYQQMHTAASARDLLYEADRLLNRHKGTVEELIILSLMYHAFRQLNETGKALETRDLMKDAFDKLPPSAYPQQGGGEYSREYWLQEWFPPEKK